MRTNIRLHLTYIFVIGFFALIFLMFWVEASDSINMQKGENTFANEINILIGVIVATIGIIFRYWFSPKNSLLPKEDFLGEAKKIEEPNPSPIVEVVEAADITPPKEDKRVQIVFSFLFFVAYFGLLFTLLYFQFCSSQNIVEGTESIFDILLILIGVLTVSITQILNYWFNKENRQEHDEVSKALFHRLVSRPRRHVETKEKAVSPPQKIEREIAPVVELNQELMPAANQEMLSVQEALQTSTPDPNIQETAIPVPEVIPEISIKKSEQIMSVLPFGTPSSGIHPSLMPLLKLGNIHKATLEQISPFVADFEQRYGINTPLRKAHFYAQLAHESGGFKQTSENLNYSAAGLLKVFGKYFPTMEEAEKYAKKPKAIANKVYANRMKNGNEASGDGYKFRGRGLIQITGKANYLAISADLGVDFVAYPDLLTRPQYLLEAAGWFWNKKDKSGFNLNHYADKNEVKTITKRINGGTNGLADRINKTAKLKQIMGA